MKVILIEDVESLGAAGEILDVKDGYARNYLIPKKKALPATSETIQRTDQFRRRREVKESKELKDAERLAEKIETISLTFERQAGEKEKLFGSVTSMDIERALREEGIEIDRKRILLDEPIKSLGIYQVPIKLHPEVTARVRLWVVQA